MDSGVAEPIVEEIRLRIFGYNVSRNVYNEEEFQRLHVRSLQARANIKNKLKSKFSFSQIKIKNLLFTMFPFLGWISVYNIKTSLLGDILSGVNTAFTHIPQVLVSLMLSQTSPVYGIFSSFFTTILYVLLGTSPHVSIGASSLLHIMMSDILKDLNSGRYLNYSNLNSSYAQLLIQNNSDLANLRLEARAHTSSTTFLAGIIQLVLASMQIGTLTTYLSEILMSAFLTAASILVLVAHVAFVLGIPMPFKSDPLAIFYNLHDYIINFSMTDATNVLVFMVCLFILWLGRFMRFDCEHFSCHLPVEFLLVVIFALLSSKIPVFARFHLKSIEEITTGFPTPILPPMSNFHIIIGEAVFLAMVSYSLLLSMAKMCALKNGYNINHNQELVTVGICNIVGSFFTTFTVSCVISRTMIQEKSGGRTQIAGLIAAFLMLAVTLKMGYLLQGLPEAVLAAIVFSNILPLLDNLRLVPHLWRQDKYDFGIWMMTFSSCILFGLGTGLAMSLLFSISTICTRTHRMSIVLIGQVPETNIYRNFLEYPETLEITGVKIFQCCSSLYFGNILTFMNTLVQMAGLDPEILETSRLQALLKHNRSRRNEPDLKCTLLKYCTVCIQSQVSNTVVLGDNLRRSAGQHDVSAMSLESYRQGQRSLGSDDETYQPRHVGHQTDLAAVPKGKKSKIGDSNPNLIKGSAISHPSQQNSEMSESELEGTPKFHTIVLDFSMVHFIDSEAAKLLSEIWYMFKESNIRILIAACQSSVMDDLERNQFFDVELTKAALFISVHDAVLFASGSDLIEEKEMTVNELERRALSVNEARALSVQNTEGDPISEEFYL